MKARLYITIDAALLEKVKVYAADNKLSLSQLVESYLTTIAENPRKESFLDIIDSLPALTNDFPQDFDFKKAYYEDRKEKYGYGSASTPAL